MSMQRTANGADSGLIVPRGFQDPLVRAMSPQEVANRFSVAYVEDVIDVEASAPISTALDSALDELTRCIQTTAGVQRSHLIVQIEGVEAHLNVYHGFSQFVVTPHVVNPEANLMKAQLSTGKTVYSYLYPFVDGEMRASGIAVPEQAIDLASEVFFNTTTLCNLLSSGRNPFAYLATRYDPHAEIALAQGSEHHKDHLDGIYSETVSIIGETSADLGTDCEDLTSAIRTPGDAIVVLNTNGRRTIHDMKNKSPNKPALNVTVSCAGQSADTYFENHGVEVSLDAISRALVPA